MTPGPTSRVRSHPRDGGAGSSATRPCPRQLRPDRARGLRRKSPPAETIWIPAAGRRSPVPCHRLRARCGASQATDRRTVPRSEGRIQHRSSRQGSYGSSATSRRVYQRGDGGGDTLVGWPDRGSAPSGAIRDPSARMRMKAIGKVRGDCGSLNFHPECVDAATASGCFSLLASSDATMQRQRTPWSHTTLLPSTSVAVSRCLRRSARLGASLQREPFGLRVEVRCRIPPALCALGCQASVSRTTRPAPRRGREGSFRLPWSMTQEPR